MTLILNFILGLIFIGFVIVVILFILFVIACILALIVDFLGG